MTLLAVGGPLPVGRTASALVRIRENPRVSIRAVLVAALITGFLLGAADVQGHGTTPPHTAPPSGTEHRAAGFAVMP